MRQSALAFAAIILAAPAALAANYDTKAYCERVGQMAGGSYAIENSCKSNEERARSGLANRTLEPAIDRYCDRVGETAGGSYAIKQSCAINEEAAKKKLESRTVEGRIRQYCDRVGQTAGGSYAILASCIDNEERARNAKQ